MSYLDNELSTYITFSPETKSDEIIDIQVNMPTDIVVNSATVFFGITIASKKKSKGWWSKDINKVGKTAKNAQLIYKTKTNSSKLETS